MNNNTFEEKTLPEENPVVDMTEIELTENKPEGLENEPQDQQSPANGKRKLKRRGGPWIWIGILFFMLLTAAGAFFGYRNGVQRRLANEKALLMEQIGLQLEWTYKDIDAGRYENAKARLDYIVEKVSVIPWHCRLDDAGDW